MFYSLVEKWCQVWNKSLLHHCFKDDVHGILNLFRFRITCYYGNGNVFERAHWCEPVIGFAAVRQSELLFWKIHKHLLTNQMASWCHYDRDLHLRLFFSLHRYHFYNVLNSCEMWISVLVCLFHVSGCTTEENSHTHTKLYCYVSTKIGASGLRFSEHTAADKHGCDEIQDPSATTQHMTPSHENSPVCLFQLQFLCIFVLVFHVSSKQKSGFVLTFVELFQCPLPDAYLLMFCFFFLFHTWPYSCNMSTLDKHSWWD